MISENFLWGSATSAYQCEGAWDEGGRVPSLWDIYLHKNNLEHGDNASNHYHCYKEDIRLMKEGGHKSYRFSLSWPRIIKNKEGEINPEGVKFYHNIIDECLKNGIEPFVTIFHWDLPQYWEDEGGWTKREVCDAYVDFAKVCFQEFGQKVKYWTTFNEPRYYVFSGYLIGNYPPGLNDIPKTIEASFYMMLANAKTVQLFKRLGINGKIGIVHSYSPVYGVDNSLETKIAMRKADNYFNNWILDTAIIGEPPMDMLATLNKKYDLSYMKEEDFNIIRENTVDFIGLNYYTRALIKPYTSGESIFRINNEGKKAKGTSKVVVKGWFEQVFDNPDSQYNDWDMEIFPEGLYEGIMRAYKKYRIPIYITENGTAFYEDVAGVDSVNDQGRIHFLNSHINAMLQAIEDGAEVLGYYVWSTMDLYSWKNGYEKRYGLIGVDFENNYERKPKASYYWYKKVCETNGDIIERSNF